MRPAGRVVILLACFLSTAAFLRRTSRPEILPPRLSFDAFPMRLGPWQGENDPIDPRFKKILGADDYLARIYHDEASAPVGVYAAYFTSQREGSMIHSPLNCLPGSGWQPRSKSLLPIALGAGSSAGAFAVNRYLIEKGLDRQLVLYWYQSHGRVVASEYASRWFLIRDAIRLNRTDAALVRIAVPLTGTADAAAERSAETQAVSFVRAMAPLLGRFLPA